jgi:3-oxoacyl-[acyl-carrier protein] reductase
MRSDRVVLVTGAANGMGRAVAEGFNRDGFAVVGVDHDAVNLATIAPACTLTAITDVADPPGVDAAVEAAVSHFGRLDACSRHDNARHLPEPAKSRLSRGRVNHHH